MPATPARIAFIKEAYRSIVKEDSAIRTRYGPVARDTQGDPVPTFFEDTADVDAINTARFALLKADRRRFDVTAAEIIEFTGGLAFSQATPAVTLIDDEKAATSITAIITSIEAVDFESRTTRVAVWG
jgi:hypothetical protein